MRLRRALLSWITIGVMFVSQAGASPRADQSSIGAPTLSNADAVVRQFIAALKRANNAGEIYYQATCQFGNGHDVLLFPRTIVQSPSTRRRGLVSVREMFQADKSVTVSQERKNLIRVRIGDVPESILRAKISLLLLTPDEQFTPHMVLDALQSNADVRASIKRLGIHPAQGLSIYPVQPPAAGLPHFPSVMRDVTVGEVLEAVAQTFHGVVLYGACSQPPLFGIRFVSF